MDATVAEAYESPLYSGSGLSFTKIFDVTSVIPNMDVTSLVTQYSGNELYYTSFAVFTNAVTSYTWQQSGALPTVVLLPSTGLDQLPSGGAISSSGQVYYSTDTGIHEYGSSVTAPALTFANSGMGKLSGNGGALAIGPGGTVYAIDPGNDRIAIYSAAGAYEGAIPLSGVTSSTALVVNGAGLVFTANGDGGGEIYSTSSESLVGSFSSSALDGAGSAGNTSLYLDPNGELYLYDEATGIHVFDTSAVPEPTATAFALGISALLASLGCRLHAARKRPLGQRS